MPPERGPSGVVECVDSTSSSYSFSSSTSYPSPSASSPSNCDRIFTFPPRREAPLLLDFVVREIDRERGRESDRESESTVGGLRGLKGRLLLKHIPQTILADAGRTRSSIGGLVRVQPLLVNASRHLDIVCEATTIYAVWLQRVTNTGQLDTSSTTSSSNYSISIVIACKACLRT